MPACGTSYLRPFAHFVFSSLRVLAPSMRGDADIATSITRRCTLTVIFIIAVRPIEGTDCWSPLHGHTILYKFSVKHLTLSENTSLQSHFHLITCKHYYSSCTVRSHFRRRERKRWWGLLVPSSSIIVIHHRAPHRTPHRPFQHERQQWR